MDTHLSKQDAALVDKMVAHLATLSQLGVTDFEACRALADAYAGTLKLQDDASRDKWAERVALRLHLKRASETR